MSSIRDAQTHDAARVNSEGQLLALATTLPEDRHVNQDHQKVWSLPFNAVDPAGAGDYFFYFKNTGTINLIFTDFRGSTTVAGYVLIEHVIGTPSYVVGTDIIPANRYLGSSNTPDAVMKVDTDITGLTGQSEIFRMDVPASGVEATQHLRTTAGIIVPPGQAFAMSWSAATGLMSGTVSVAALL